MGGDEPAIEGVAFLLHEIFNNFNSGFAQHFYSSTTHEREGVGGANYNASYSFINKEEGAWGRFAIVGAGFEGDINGGVFYQMLILGANGGHGVDFGMGLAEFAMPSFADYSAGGGNHHCANHRVRRDETGAVGCQLQGALHIFFFGGREHIT